MRIVADESVDGPIVRALRRKGHDVSYVAELSAGISDLEVLALARASDAPLLTADSDSGELVYRQHRAHTGVLLFQLSGLVEAEKVEHVLSAMRITRVSSRVPSPSCSHMHFAFGRSDSAWSGDTGASS